MLRVIRAVHSQAVHVADVPDTDVDRFYWFGHPYVGVHLPQLTACGRRLVTGRTAVLLRPSMPITCLDCQAVSGLWRAPRYNLGIPEASEATQPMDTYS